MRAPFVIFACLLTVPALAIPTEVSPFKKPLPGTTSKKEPVLAGTVIMDETSPFASAGPEPVTGVVDVRMVRQKDNKITFYWRIKNAATSKGSIKSFYVDGFTAQVYDANWRSDGLGGVAPTHVLGTNSSLTTGWVLAFEFATPIKPGESSQSYFLRTDATNYTSSKATMETTKKHVFGIKIRAPAK